MRCQALKHLADNTPALHSTPHLTLISCRLAAPQDAVSFLEQIKARVAKASKGKDKLAESCATTAIAELKLRLGDVAAAKVGAGEWPCA